MAGLRGAPSGACVARGLQNKAAQRTLNKSTLPKHPLSPPRAPCRGSTSGSAPPRGAAAHAPRWLTLDPAHTAKHSLAKVRPLAAHTASPSSGQPSAQSGGAGASASAAAGAGATVATWWFRGFGIRGLEASGGLGADAAAGGGGGRHGHMPAGGNALPPPVVQGEGGTATRPSTLECAYMILGPSMLAAGRSSQGHGRAAARIGGDARAANAAAPGGRRPRNPPTRAALTRSQPPSLAWAAATRASSRATAAGAGRMVAGEWPRWRAGLAGPKAPDTKVCAPRRHPRPSSAAMRPDPRHPQATLTPRLPAPA